MPTVLVVDLDMELGGLLKERLLEYEIDVVQTETGGEALVLARKIRPSVIVHELALPDISGFYILGKLRAFESTCHIPVVVLTHRDEPNLEERAIQGGAAFFVRKPYEAKTFITKLRDLAYRPMGEDDVRKIRAQIKLAGDVRQERLVTERLQLEIRTDHYLLRGLTSGINENGMGAHVNLLEKFAVDVPALAAGQICHVTFRSTKYPLMPCEGRILRLEESWDRRYRQFIAIKFMEEETRGMMDYDRSSLREWIREQMK